MNTLLLLGILSVAVATLSYAFYFRDMFRGTTRPHGLTWFIWGLLNTFIFIQQLSNDAGPGAWVTGVAAVANLTIFGLSFHYGEKHITKLDWLCLSAALCIFLFWYQTADAQLAVVFASLLFMVGFIPTVRKAWMYGGEETAVTYGLNSLKFFIALFALNSFTLLTALYPFSLMCLNAGFVVYLFVIKKRTTAKVTS